MAHNSKISILLIISLVCIAKVSSFVQTEYNTELQGFPYSNNKVDVRLYYESHCPYCIAEYRKLPSLIYKLGPYIHLTTLPYGHAKMLQANNGSIIFQCQHGETECYGNKLHACAISYLGYPRYVDYNACLMDRRSNDQAADIESTLNTIRCGQMLGEDSNSIKQCAKSGTGSQLLMFYGVESGKVYYKGVPFVLINGRPKPSDQSLFDAVCDALARPPPECRRPYYYKR